MYFKLDFICMGFAELRGIGSKQEIQNENMYPAGFEPITVRNQGFRLGPLDHNNI